jgi:hypothetical protein
MPYSRPGRMFYTVATKAVNHGLPVIEQGVPGVAVKQRRASSGAGSGTPQYQIAITEPMAIITKGVVQVVNTGSGLSAAAPGTPIYIIAASNLLTTTPAGNVKYGMLLENANVRGTPPGYCRIDLDKRDMFV